MWLCLARFFDTYGSMISTVALIITLGVLIKYTVETTRLRKETVKQTKISQRPFVTIYDSKYSGIKYKNSGEGIALNIQIMPFKYRDCTIEFSKETVLGSKEESNLSIDRKVISNETGEVFAQQVFPFEPNELKHAELDDYHFLEIRYKGINNVRYKTWVRIHKGGIVYMDYLVVPEEEPNLFQRLKAKLT